MNDDELKQHLDQHPKLKQASYVLLSLVAAFVAVLFVVALGDEFANVFATIIACISVPVAFWFNKIRREEIAKYRANQ